MALDSLTSTMFRTVTDTRMTRVRDLAKQLQATTANTKLVASREGDRMTRGADGTVHYHYEINSRSGAYASDLARNWTNGFRVQANEAIDRLKPLVERTDEGPENIRKGEKWAREQLDLARKDRTLIMADLERGYSEQPSIAEDGTRTIRKVTGAEFKQRTDNALRSIDRTEKQSLAALEKLPEQWKQYEADRADRIKTQAGNLEFYFGFKTSGEWLKDPAGDHAFGDYSLSFSMSVGPPAGDSYTAGYTQNNGDAALSWSTTVNGQTTTSSYSGKAALAFLTKPFESAEMQKRHGRGSGPENYTGIDVTI